MAAGFSDTNIAELETLRGQLQQLQEQVNRNHAQLLQQMVVAPQKQLQSDHELQILSVLLRTKLAPEIERAEEQIKEQMEEEARTDQQQMAFGGQPDGAGNAKYWQAKTEVHDALALTAEVAFKELRKRHSNTAGSTGHGMDVDEAVKEEKAAVALEDVLAFVSSGTRA
ncbi:hypothetical protein DL89DRAFT_264453 [Linderina pennispora]|uniref:Mediator of RNA polymerase II transcription subunit 8 n=1 Tax=Linderina pennispora TaxID=61395 RepID=A0A1Y1WMC0_9FUNG|nr:uncharacterized protein DL89DRAFT_264453 [Linderina pennispora]ORX74632.1 hypothetical protein DL89DRAFT_264453 [Linderina pennispora]